MNNIFKTQNSEYSIQLLKAQRRLYSLSRRLSLISFMVSIPLIIVSAVVATFFTGFSVWYAYVSILALLTGQASIIFSTSYREKAASVQNLFDASVLELDSNSLLFSSNVPFEEIKYHADRISKTDDRGLENWYPESVTELPIQYARILCQRANCQWNLTQRMRYLLGLKIIIIATFFLIIALGLSAGTTLEGLLLYVVLPLLPILNWSFGEVVSHVRSTTSLSSLRDQFEGILNSIKKKTLSDEELLLTSIQIQDAINVSRSSDALIPGFVYWLLRDEQEDGMQFSTEQLVRQINSSL